jgi:hypothetical protein
MSVSHTALGRGAGEVPAHQLVVHGRPRGLARAAATLLGDGRPDAVVTAQAPHPPLAHVVTDGLELVGDEPVAELRIISMDIYDRV